MTFVQTKPWALYNEIDDFAASWLEQLIAAGHIANGVVDRRSIEDLSPDELRGFRQVHLFAGVGVWSHALRRTGVSDDANVWTGSCPCQPFSAAGKGAGMDDERHLWPHFHHLIRECRPRLVFGEQVASKDGLGWLDLVQADMEATDYAFGAVDTCAAGLGAPHIRQRLYWFGERLADSDQQQRHGRGNAGATGRRKLADVRSAERMAYTDGGQCQRLTDGEGSERDRAATGRIKSYGQLECGGSVGWLDDLLGEGLEGLGSGHRSSAGQRQGSLRPVAPASEFDGLADPDFFNDDRAGFDASDVGWKLERAPILCGVKDPLGLADALGDTGSEVGSGHDAVDEQWSPFGWGPEQPAGPRTDVGIGIGHNSAGCGELGPAGYLAGLERPGPTNGFWRAADWLFCRDGKWRPVEPGTFPLAHGAAARVGRLRGYGNAINAAQAIGFIEAFFEAKAIKPDAVDGDAPPAQVTDAFEDLLG